MTAADLMERLRDTDRHVRDDAFDRIAASDDPGLLPLLMDAATEGDATVEALLCRYLAWQPAAVAFKPLRQVLASANRATREHACETLGAFAIDTRLDLLLELLRAPHDDVVCYALRELGAHRRTVAIPAIAELLDAASVEVAEAAFTALSHIDHPRATKALLPRLAHAEASRRILAYDALGAMGPFRRWRRLLPGLEDDEAAVRRAAVRTISQVGGPKAQPVLVRLLATEPDEEVLKLILSRLALAPDEEVAVALIPMAATHDNPQVRRAAGWVVEEFDDEVMAPALAQLLGDGRLEVTAYALVKMGMRELEGAGERIVELLDGDPPARVRYAALEALGFLRQPRWLDHVVPFLRDPDPMTAYVATLTAAQLAPDLRDCPDLVDILNAPDEEAVALKQVVLQFMIDGISWTFDDELFELVVRLLASSNENVSYLAAILLGRGSGRQQLVPPLLAAALDHQHPEVSAAAREGLDGVLDGRLAPLFERLDRQPGVIGLLPGLRWDAASVDEGVGRLDGAASRGELSEEDLRSVAVAVVAADPNRLEPADLHGLAPAWRRALGLACLDALGDLSGPRAQERWQALLDDDDDALVVTACAQAVEHRPPWAAGLLLRRAARAGTGPAADALRRGVRELLEL